MQRAECEELGPGEWRRRLKRRTSLAMMMMMMMTTKKKKKKKKDECVKNLTNTLALASLLGSYLKSNG